VCSASNRGDALFFNLNGHPFSARVAWKGKDQTIWLYPFDVCCVLMHASIAFVEADEALFSSLTLEPPEPKKGWLQ